MDKYEFNIKVEQMKKLMKKKDFITAVKIADSIDWEKVKENQLLIMAADVYEIAGKFDAARDVLIMAYERTGLGRQLAYRLCRLSVKRGDIAEAEEFYVEFTQNSPRDAGKYILQYEMAKGKGEAIEKQIEILETYIEEDMDDRWAYELAKLYHKAHLREKCIELCDTIILWFADGKYVEKALELKQLYVPLSENQRLKYEAQKSRRADMSHDMASQVQEPQAVQEESEQKADEMIPSHINEDEGATEEQEATKPAYVEKQNGDILDEVHEADIDVNSIHFKDYSVNNKYDTVNLQMELAKSVSSLFDNTIEIFKPNARKIEEEEPVEDDQIEGQMSLEEVLAMFESGEIQTRKEDVAEVTEEFTETEETMAEAVNETDEIEEIEELEDIEDELEEDFEDNYEENFENDFEEEEIEEAQDVEEVEKPIFEDGSFNEENGFNQNSSEEEIVAELIAREIEFDISESVDNEITKDITKEQEEIAQLLEEIEEAEEAGSMDEPEEDSFDEEAEEEYSEDAESEIQESMPVMYDLKSEAAEEKEESATEESTTEDSTVGEATIKEDAVDEGEASNEDEVDDNTKVQSKEKSAKSTLTSGASIQSETAKEELKNFIARFSGVQGLDKQILKVMQNTLKVEKKPVKFILVKGEVKSGKTTLAIEVIKLANKIMQRRDQKIAKIKAESINGKSVDGLLGKLNGSDVLIEKVSDMEPDTFVEFVNKLEAEGKERFVVFEDEKSLAEAFLEKLPGDYGKFANVLDIKQNRIKDWTKMASDYAKEQGYTFDEMGTLALSAKIDQLRAITLVVHKNHVEQLVDGAIKKNSRFSFRKLFGRAKDENGLILLTEKDFID